MSEFKRELKNLLWALVPSIGFAIVVGLEWWHG